jgi:hypothetical protein
MTLFFSRQTKPNPQKNFVQNYMDHLSYVSLDFKEKLILPIFDARETSPLFVLQHLYNQAVARLYVFKAFHDRYDVMDEIGGVALLPLVVACISVGFLGFAIWEAIKSLAVTLHLTNPDVDKNYNIINNNTVAMSNLVIAGSALVLSLGIFMKSALSLVTRSLVTLCTDFQNQEVDRFFSSSVQAYSFG